MAAVTFNVSNLSSSVTSVHLRIGPTGDFVFTLPYAASGTAQWLLLPTGNYSNAALLAALALGVVAGGAAGMGGFTGRGSTQTQSIKSKFKQRKKR